MAKINWKTASNRRVVGEWVEVKSLPGIDARVKPRKYSQAGADEINAWAVSRSKFKHEADIASLEALAQVEAELKDVPAEELAEAEAKVKAAKEEKLLTVFAGTDPEILKQSGYMAIVLKYGIAEYEFGDEAGPPTDAWIRDVLDDVELAGELLGIVQVFNGPLARKTSDTSESSPAGNTEA